MYCSGWKIGTAIKGPAIGCEKDVQGPAAAAGHGLYGIHIYMVQIRPLFPVDLDIDKMLIHERGRFLVLKTLLFHNMAPMTGGITNAYQQGFVQLLRLVQRFISPGIPVNGVMRML